MVPLRPALLAFSLSVLSAAPAMACACCTEIGQRFEGMLPQDTSRSELLSGLAWQPTARFYASVAFPDDVKGVTDPSSEPMALTVTRLSGALMFSLTGHDGKRSAALQFNLPRQIHELAVDTRDADQEGGTGPGLYREWRLKGSAKLSGFLARAAPSARVTLILHGRGNSCVSAEDFHAWTLIVKDHATAFTLLGRIGADRGENDSQ